MNREEQLSRLDDSGKVWDVVVIGGGATGLGCAVDAASRGYETVLFEREDFAKCTSSRSTKLVHGGVRYLQKLEVDLVREALHERGIMKRNAPHLVKDQAFVISNYSYWDNFLYFCGLLFYDILSFGFGYGRSRFISAKKVMEYIPTSVEKGLKGGVVYHDGQFDDSRMAINLAQTAVEQGAAVANYTAVERVLHGENGKACGVVVRDLVSGKEYTVTARCVINAAGIFVDEVMRMDEPDMPKMVVPSQGVHLVLDMKFLRSDYAIMVPKTSDGRVLFAVPWHDKVVVGTTDIQRPVPESEPKPLEEEIDFILGTAGLYMNPAPTRKDIVSVFAGQRPLAAPKKEGKNSKEVSRSHKIIVSDHDLITITGGKWTSYRRMAEDTIDRAIKPGQSREAQVPHPHAQDSRLSAQSRSVGPHVCLRQRRARHNQTHRTESRLGRTSERKVRLHRRRGGLGRSQGDGVDGRGCVGTPCAYALRGCPRGARRRPSRSGNHGRRVRSRRGLDRSAGRGVHRNCE